MDYTMLGAMLTVGRRSRGLSQKTVAEQLGVTAQNVSSWERGKSRMDLDRYLRLCSLYSLDPVSTLRACATDSAITGDDGDENILGELDAEERQLLTLFRGLDGEGREFILTAIRLASLANGTKTALL